MLGEPGRYVVRIALFVTCFGEGVVRTGMSVSSARSQGGEESVTAPLDITSGAFDRR